MKKEKEGGVIGPSGNAAPLHLATVVCSFGPLIDENPSRKDMMSISRATGFRTLG